MNKLKFFLDKYAKIEYLHIFYTWEKRKWGDKVFANKYFASICILIMGISSALYIVEIFDRGWEDGFRDVFITMFALWGLLVAESIVSTKDVYMAVKRGVVLLAILFVVMVVCLLLSGLILLALAIFAVLLIISFVCFNLIMGGGVSFSSSSSTNKKEEDSENIAIDGMNISGRSNLSGDTFYGNNGKTYRDSGGIGPHKWEESE